MRAGSLLIAVITVAASPALAGTITTYTSSAAFNAALSGLPSIVETYSTFTAGTIVNPGDTLDGITYTSFNLGADGTQGLISNQFNAISGVSLGANEDNGAAQFFFDGDSFDITFAPVTAIGVFYNVNQNSGTFGITTPVGDASTGSAAYDTGTFVFAGLISSTPFTSANIFSNSGGNGTASFNIPEIELGQQTATPEPASFVMTALGAALLAALVWRRRSRLV